MAAIRFKVNAPSKSAVLRLLDSTSWADAKLAIIAALPGLDAATFSLMTKRTREPIAGPDTDDAATIASLGITNAAQFDVENPGYGSTGAAGASASGTTGAGGASADGGSSGPAAAGAMRRVTVKADNTCLFTAVGFLAMGNTKEMGRYVRELAASLIPGAGFPDGTLDGKTPAEYQAWLLDDTHWGGAIELTVLARQLGRRFAVVEVKSGTVYRFGSEGKCSYLVNDGIHYDPLARDTAGTGSEAGFDTEFEHDDPAPLEEAKAIAANMKAVRAFVDTSSFDLLCLQCNTPLKGQKEAQAHAGSTGHTNFTQL